MSYRYKSVKCLRRSLGLRPSLTSYDVLTALRGPDMPGAEAIKSLVTARVRGIVFLRACPGAYKTTPATQDTVDIVAENVSALPKIGDQWTHFLHHLAKAVGQTAGHRVWGGYAREIVLALGGKEYWVRQNRKRRART